MSLILIILFPYFSAFSSTEIILSKKIKAQQQVIINEDLKVLEQIKFRENTDQKTLLVLGINELNTDIASLWLHRRVKYIVEEKAFSTINKLLKKNIYIEKENVDYPNPDLNTKKQKLSLKSASSNSVMMTNIGSAIYSIGKAEKKLYGVKLQDSLTNKTQYVRIDSPRSGVVQIGNELFNQELLINRINPKAIANSILRLVFLFHEARHSDGNGESLGFHHTLCPIGHDYENQYACDENLNGAYSVGAAFAKEMMLSCPEDQCSERDKEMLKIFLFDNYSRIQSLHNNSPSTYWDATPEKL